jgi:hypothetical protein
MKSGTALTVHASAVGHPHFHPPVLEPGQMPALPSEKRDRQDCQGVSQGELQPEFLLATVRWRQLTQQPQSLMRWRLASAGIDALRHTDAC